MSQNLQHFEVEQKFRVASLQPTLDTLAAMNLEVQEAIEQIDRYYRHPQRDFAETDEAFRLRSVGSSNCITYKGPKIDVETKTRCEEEVALAEGEQARSSCDAIMLHLGFTPAATVTKQRRTAHLERDGMQVEFALDTVESLGEFVEIEIGVTATGVDDPAMQQARELLASLAEQLGLVDVERRGYLDLLLSE